VTVFLTAFYMFRAIFVAFFGPAAAGAGGRHPHDPPPVMQGPLWVLAVGTLGAGILATDRLGLPFAAFLHRDAAWPHGPAWLLPLSVGLAVAGIVAAWAVYQRGLVSPAALAAAFGPLRAAAERGYGIDAVYLAVYRGVLLGLARLTGFVDRYLVDGVVNVASAWTLRAGAALRQVQTGRAQDYLYALSAGLLMLIVLWEFWP
jgi:NADH-quinone oxidoreductase subunit L